MTRKASRRKSSAPTPSGPAYEPCASCLHGWVTVWNTRPGFVPLPTVERCWCWTAHQAKLAEQADAKP